MIDVRRSQNLAYIISSQRASSIIPCWDIRVYLCCYMYASLVRDGGFPGWESIRPWPGNTFHSAAVSILRYICSCLIVGAPC